MGVSAEHRLDAEQAVLGAMLIDPEIVRTALSRVQEADFASPVNRTIFQAFREQFRRGQPTDAITVRNRVGGEYSGYMADLMDVTPSSADWEAYAEIMRQQAALRRIREGAETLLTARTLDECRPVCARMGQQLTDGTETASWTMAEMAEDFCTAQDPAAPQPKYIDYGLDILRGKTYTKPGDVVIIGGYPSDGKTALALQMAYHMAADYKVGFFSLETDRAKIRDRLMANVAQIEFDRIKTRTLTEEDWTAFAAKSADMARRTLTVVEASGMTATGIQSLSQAYGFDVIFLDYVQLVATEADPRTPRHEQMATISRQLHTFAQKSQTLVVELAQLSRPDKASGWRAPVMSDLKESGQFEQDADMIFMLYRPNPKKGESGAPALDQNKFRNFKIAKNKEGPRGTWLLAFDGARQTFSTVVDPSGLSVVRQLVDAGKAARQKPRQVSFWGDGSDWAELSPGTETPFDGEKERT